MRIAVLLPSLLVIACVAAGVISGAEPERSPTDLQLSRKDAGATTYSLVVYQLWGSDNASPAKPPKVLKALLPKLRKHSKKKSFRLVEKPLVRALPPGQLVNSKLPQGYSVRWTLSLDAAGKPRVRQELTNPKKKKSVLLIKKGPFVTELGKIRDGADTFILVVDFVEKKPTGKTRS